jgi:hypothetical protein
VITNDEAMRRVSKWINRRVGLLLLAAGFILSMVLGYLGFSRLPTVEGGTPSAWDRAYLTFQLFIGESGYVAMPVSWELEVARILAPLVSAYAAISALVLVFYERFHLFWARLTYRNHVVICGLGEIGSRLALKMQEAGKRVIVIEPDARHEHITQAKEKGAVVITGNPTDPAVLRSSRVGRAEAVIAACETDGLNSDIAEQVGRLVQPGRTVKCYAHITNRFLCHFLMGQAITTQTNTAYQLEFFSIYDSGSRLLLSQSNIHHSQSPGEAPHLVIIGLGALGESLVVRAERLWRPEAAATEKKLRLSILDSQATRRLATLKLEYPFLAETCEIEAHDLDLSSPEFLQGWEPFARSQFQGISKVFLCLEDDHTALTAAFMLQQRMRSQEIPLVAVLNQYDGLAKSLNWQRERAAGMGPGEGREWVVFSFLDQTCQMGLLNEGIYEDLAMAIHQVFTASEIERGRSASDAALAPWYPQAGKPGLAEHYKEANRRQARSIGARLWSQGYGIEPINRVENARFAFDDQQPLKAPQADRLETELETLARLEHEDWRQERLRQGWRPGTQRDPEHKIHDLLYGWDDPRLKESAREQTRQIVRNWPALLAQVDLQIYRR